MSTSTKASLEDLQEGALHTARRLVIHRGYGGSERRAFRALRRGSPGWSEDEYLHWLRLACKACEEAVPALERNRERAFEIYNEERKELDLLPAVPDFAEAHAVFADEHLRGVLNLIFLHHHLR